MRYLTRQALREGLDNTRSLVRVARANERQPDEWTLDGIRLRLGAWATPPIRRSIYCGLYEGRERAILAATLDAHDRYLEVGIGTGVVMTAAARVCGADRVAGYDADPRIVAVARATAAANGVQPMVVNAALTDRVGTVAFYPHEDFWLSSLEPNGSDPIEVPTLCRDDEIERHGATYLMVDIEGGEIDLLAEPLPATIAKVCIECHPAVTGAAAITAMLRRLFDQGFQLDVDVSVSAVLFLARQPAQPRAASTRHAPFA